MGLFSTRPEPRNSLADGFYTIQELQTLQPVYADRLLELASKQKGGRASCTDLEYKQYPVSDILKDDNLASVLYKYRQYPPARLRLKAHLGKIPGDELHCIADYTEPETVEGVVDRAYQTFSVFHQYRDEIGELKKYNPPVWHPEYGIIAGLMHAVAFAAETSEQEPIYVWYPLNL